MEKENHCLAIYCLGNQPEVDSENNLVFSGFEIFSVCLLGPQKCT
jgi:hypothetical protein